MLGKSEGINYVLSNREKNSRQERLVYTSSPSVVFDGKDENGAIDGEERADQKRKRQTAGNGGANVHEAVAHDGVGGENSKW